MRSWYISAFMASLALSSFAQAPEGGRGHGGGRPAIVEGPAGQPAPEAGAAARRPESLPDRAAIKGPILKEDAGKEPGAAGIPGGAIPSETILKSTPLGAPRTLNTPISDQPLHEDSTPAGGTTILRGRSTLQPTPGASRALVTPSIDAGVPLGKDQTIEGRRGRAFGGTETPALGATPVSRPDALRPGESLPPGLTSTPATGGELTPVSSRATPRLAGTPATGSTPAATATEARPLAIPSRTMPPTSRAATPLPTTSASTGTPSPAVTGTPAGAAATPFVPTGAAPGGAGRQVGIESRKLAKSTATPGKFAGTITASPTPGNTPVPTPASATPTPANWTPPKTWAPYAGWSPPVGWTPPPGWVPPGGWNPPPGWNPPSDWVPRLFRWGWTYVPGRGWVVPPGWVPPSDFVVPPGWYYLPTQTYSNYGFYNPGSVVVVPGVARRDLITAIDTSQAYYPPEDIPQFLEEQPAPPPRVMPETPPQLTDVQSKTEVVETLTRERKQGDRYGGPVLVTQTIHFDFDSYAIKPESFPALDAIGDSLINPPLDKAIINIEGHTDSDGSNEYNQVLSERRAWSVKSYLVQKFGIDPNRLIIVGYGEEAPIASNDTEEGKALNRRVEFENVTDLYQNAQANNTGDAAAAETAKTY